MANWLNWLSDCRLDVGTNSWTYGIPLLAGREFDVFASQWFYRSIYSQWPSEIGWESLRPIGKQFHYGISADSWQEWWRFSLRNCISDRSDCIWDGQTGNNMMSIKINAADREETLSLIQEGGRRSTDSFEPRFVDHGFEWNNMLLSSAWNIFNFFSGIAVLFRFGSIGL